MRLEKGGESKLRLHKKKWVTGFEEGNSSPFIERRKKPTGGKGEASIERKGRYTWAPKKKKKKQPTPP